MSDLSFLVEDPPRSNQQWADLGQSQFNLPTLDGWRPNLPTQLKQNLQQMFADDKPAVALFPGHIVLRQPSSLARWRPSSLALRDSLR